MSPPSFLPRDLLFLTLFLSLLFGAFLGTRPLMVPDEGRYAEIPREMVETGDYLTPRLNYIKYFEKPPLFYWMTAASVHAFGVQEWGLRAVVAIVSLLGCLMVYIAGLRLYDRRTGIFACLMLASCALYFSMARFVITDMPLTVWMTISLLLFMLGTQEPVLAKKRYYFWGMYGFAALAVMTKGLVGAVLPGMVIFVWLCITREWKQLRAYCIPTGSLLFLAIAAPWHVLVQLKNPEFFQFYFIAEHFLRYFTDYAGRQQAVWFFPAITFGGFFPWICFVLAFIVHAIPRWRYFIACEKSKQTVFCIVWVLVLFLFFSLSKSQLLSYALPLMPPLALLAARYFSLHAERASDFVMRLGFLLVAVLGTAIAFVGAIALYAHPLPSPASIWAYTALCVMGVGSIGSAILYLRAVSSCPARTALRTLVCTMGIFLVIGDVTYPHIDTRSIKPLIAVLQPKLKPDTQIVAYRNYYQDLPAYLGRRVTIVAYRGELAFGMAHQDTRAWVFSEAYFWQHMVKTAHVLVLTSREDYQALTPLQQAQLHLLASTPQNLLLTNIP